MADLKWFLRRLRAMRLPEITWRVQQKLLQLSEEKRFRRRRPVTEAVFYPKRAGRAAEAAASGKIATERLFLNHGNGIYTLGTSIPLPAPYRYEDYRTAWHAGFQTGNDWPFIPSARIDYRGMDAVGDARTNWELNKHFQFALLAKDYCASGERRFLDELMTLFDDWNAKNPFLWGISWTSAIEVAERTINWCYMLGFLRAASDVPAAFLSGIGVGIANMADWLFHHYSRYSSANNHLIVEISAILHAGAVLDDPGWVDHAVRILTRELELQNYPDGVNKEEALYYQVFMMEAYALDLRLLKENGWKEKETAAWQAKLTGMARYVRTCIGKYGEVVAFGDNDDGKLLDLTGCGDGDRAAGGLRRYRFVLQMMSLLLPERYAVPNPGDEDEWCEEVRWLYTEEELAEAEAKPLFVPEGSADYAIGGNAVLCSTDGEVLIGIDHAPLGYGALCAHGHADALSFVAFVGGRPFLCDPGTYIYHMDEEARNDFRRTARHNTVCVGGADQSEMLGAFLWGKKAVCRLVAAEFSDEQDVIEAEHDGYAPYIHRRKFVFDRKAQTLTVEDRIGGAEDAVFHLLFSAGVRAEQNGAGVWRCVDEADRRSLGTITFAQGFEEIALVDREISAVYGVKEPTTGLRAVIRSEPAVCVIQFGGSNAVVDGKD